MTLYRRDCMVVGMTDNLTTTLVERHAEIHDLLTEIASKIDDVNPDTANWGHAGDLGRIAELLRQAAGHPTGAHQ